MKALSLLLLMTLLPLSMLTGLEFISEHIDDRAMNLILIPYSDLFFQLDGNRKVYDNRISLAIYTEDEEIVYQESFHLQFGIEPEKLDNMPPVSYNREYYPLKFQTDLKPGTYGLYVGIRGLSGSMRRELREEFIFPERSKSVGFLFFSAMIDEFRFLIRDKRYLYREYDSLEVTQYHTLEPDSSRIVIEKSDETLYILPEETGRLAEILQEGGSFSLELEHFVEGRRFISKPIYPNPAYFFQQRYTAQEQLAQLRYVINQNEYQYLRSLSEGRLQGGINELWLSKDPDPYTTDNIYQETFYQRVRYADNNYRIRRYMPGWRTDMGRIYIMYGEPDNVISDVFPLGKPPSITWQYYSLNRVFVFYDLRGYGNYELRDKWQD